MNEQAYCRRCAVGCFAAYLFLGLLVSHAPVSFIDRAGEAFFLGKAVPLAILFTRIGTLPVYVAICTGLLLFGFLRRAWLSSVVFSVTLLIAAWCVSDAGKTFFARPRMEHWIAMHETSFSYASGHATLSSAFYGLWIYFVLKNFALPAPLRYVIAACLLLLIIAVGWSRLALGAHYVSDVVGGYLLGVAGFCTTIAFFTVRSRLTARAESRRLR